MSPNDNVSSIPDEALAPTHMNGSQLCCPSQSNTLPRKIGELGYIHGASVVSSNLQDPSASATDTGIILEPPDRNSPLPHPAASSNVSLPSNVSSQSSIYSLNSHKILSYLLKRSGRPVDEPHFHGVHLLTILRLVIITFALIGTILGWVLTILFVNQLRRNQEASTSSPDSTASSNGSVTQSIIFIHVTFATIALFLLILLERLVFIARAERHNFLYPQDTAVRVDSFARSAARVPYVPWGRLPLPTYAAALGYRGTGDVEDAVIVGPAPPEYGNTRGSTLLLVGPASSAELRRSGSSRSDRSVMSLRSVRSGVSERSEVVRDGEEEEGPGDQTWRDERRMSNVDLLRRAQRMEEELAALDQGVDGSIAPSNTSDLCAASERTCPSEGSTESGTSLRNAGDTAATRVLPPPNSN